VLYHGVFAPRAPWRRLIVPAAPTPAKAPEAAGVPSLRARPANRTWAELMQRSFRLRQGYGGLAGAREREGGWLRRLGVSTVRGRLRLVALIQSAAVITRILGHLQLSDAPPTMRASRDPPLVLLEMDDHAVFAE
jgi:hypothetical protein